MFFFKSLSMFKIDILKSLTRKSNVWTSLGMVSINFFCFFRWTLLSYFFVYLWFFVVVVEYCVFEYHVISLPEFSGGFIIIIIIGCNHAFI